MPKRFLRSRFLFEEADPGAAGGGGGGGERDWLPEAYRNDPTFAEYKTADDVYKTFKNQQSMIGADKVVLPKETGTPEQWNEYYKKVGRPDAPEGYGLGDEAKDVASLMHKHGLTKKQATALYEDYKGMATQSQEAAAAQYEAKKAEGMNQLKALWGDKFDEKLAAAQRALNNYLGGDQNKLASVKKKLEATGLGNDPEIVEMFANIGMQSAEDVAKTSGALKTPAMDTKEGAMAEIKRLNADSDFLSTIMDPNKPGYKEANMKMNRLYDIAYGSEEDMAGVSPDVAEGHKKIMGLI